MVRLDSWPAPASYHHVQIMTYRRFIPTVAKSLSLIYYITNYAAKDDVSPWQMVAKAALHSRLKKQK